MSRTDTEHLRPMPLAELDACCGQYGHASFVLGQAAADHHCLHCENCPLLIERKREAALRLARAL